ncbi:signal peptidase I [Arthrobacter sp. Marseille-P9274]|uniref:signal peptidase I n=1 Tax=Arthrobacter sp. Marseille-P9274 TaxID=2866572 RepID=UPI0021C5FC26|nr:signal peptidase I [Arthrobacter sp. Marseille-P9274]
MTTMSARSGRTARSAGGGSRHAAETGPATPPRKQGSRLGTILTTAVLILAAAAFLFLAIGPRVLGYQTSTMLTGSMSPLINPGDVVVSVPVPVGSITEGDIITYHIPVEDQRVETHRIIEVTTNADGTTAVRTKGDANNGADPWTATLQGDTVYRHAFTIPHLGTVIRTLREPAVRNTLMYGAPALLVAGMLVNIWRKPKDEDAAEAVSAGTAQTAPAADATTEPTRHG